MPKNIIALILLLSGCYIVTDNSKYADYEYNIPAGPFYSIEEVIAYTSVTISYEQNSGASTPIETFNSKSGDCEDFCIFAMYLIKRDLNIVTRMAIGDMSHAFIEYHGKYYEPIYGIEVTTLYNDIYDSIVFLDYEDAIALCYD